MAARDLYSGAQRGVAEEEEADCVMDQSPLAHVLGHLAQLSEQQNQLQRVQGGLLAEMSQTLRRTSVWARVLAEDQAVRRKLIASGGGRDGGDRGARAVPRI